MTDNKSSPSASAARETAARDAAPKEAAAKAAAAGSAGTKGRGNGDGLAGDPALFNANLGHTMLELQREWIAGMGQIQRDYLSFVGERMRKDIEVAKRMAECRDVQAAMELQAAFVETAREDYMAEAHKLIEMSREMTQSCIERLSETPGRDTSGRN